MTTEQLQHKEIKLWRMIQAITQDDNLLDLIQELVDVNIELEELRTN